MRVAGVQIAVSRESKDRNLSKATEWVGKAAGAGARLICLQEFLPYGAFTLERNPENFELAETITDETVTRMAEAARNLNVYLMVPLFERDEKVRGRYYNSSIIVNPNGQVIGRYRKQFIPLNASNHEKYYFTPGQLGSPVFHADDLCFGVMICFDRHFLEVPRTMVLKGADVLFDSTSTRKRPGRDNVWQPEHIAMAANNGVYVVGVNSTGDGDGKAQFGGSLIVDPFGAVVDSLDEEEGFVSAEISREVVERSRSTYFCLRDLRRDVVEEMLQNY